MTKVIDKLISINKDLGSDQNIFHNKTTLLESGFVYNSYEEEETFVNDSIIDLSLNENSLNRRYIRISMPLSFRHDSIERNGDYIEELRALSNFSSIDSNTIKYFNKISKIISHRKHVILDTNREEADIVSEFYNFDNISYRNKLLYSKKISLIDEDFSGSNIESFTLNSDFPEAGLKNILDNYDDIIYNDSEKKEISESDYTEYFEECDFFSNLTEISKQVNDLDFKKFAKRNSIKCGILVEKFKKSEEQFKFLSARFLTNLSGNSMKFNIEDLAVRYGETYKYIISEVFFYSYPSPSNRFILNNYLICDNIYSTKDIECREYEPPPPPNNLKFKVDKNNNLKINWKEPVDYQYDAKGYQILKRHRLDEPFKIIAQLEGHLDTDDYIPVEDYSDTIKIKTPGLVKYSYIDSDYDKAKITIYAIRTIDAHGMFSNYSSQVAVLYDPFEEKLIYDEVSESGAKKDKPNELIDSKSIFFKNKINIIDNLPLEKNVKKFCLYLAPDYGKIKRNSGLDDISTYSESQYQFTICKVNDLSIYQKKFEINNFNSTT